MTDREKAVKAEMRKLNAIFGKLPEDKKKLCEGLIQNAAFMHVTLQELQEDIVEHGAMIQAQSGNGFDTIKDNPAQKAYTTMISRYSAIIGQLASLIPEDKDAAKNQSLLDWVNAQ